MLEYSQSGEFLLPSLQITGMYSAVQMQSGDGAGQAGGFGGFLAWI
jgi:hypothetical protein